MSEQEDAEAAEQELKEAEGAFKDVDVLEPKKEETAGQNQQILAALGFKPYHDAGVTKYSIWVMNIKIGATFNETNPLGKVWAYYISEGDEDKVFLKNGELAEHPLIQKYRAIQEDKEPIPEISVVGEITEKRGKAIKVEITENGENKAIFFGQGAVKTDKDGHFIPTGFSRATKDHEAKMAVPRDIRLPDYETQLEQAPATDTTKEKNELPKKPDELAKTDLQPTEKTIMDEVIKSKEIEYTDTRVQVTEAELIQKYTNLLANVTEAILAEDRIPSREKGYAVKFVYYSVIGEMKKTELSETTIEAIAKAILNADKRTLGPAQGTA